MASQASDLWGGVQSGMSSLGSALSSGVRGVGNFLGKAGDFIGLDGNFGLSGPTGQPSPGSPGAAGANFSQSVPDFNAGGVSPIGPMSFAPASGAVADVGDASALDMAMDQMGMGGAGMPQSSASPITFGAGSPGTLMQPGGGDMAAPAPSGGGGGILERLLGGRDPMELAIPAGVLGYTLWQGQQPVQGVEDLRALAEGAAGRAATSTEMAQQAMMGNLPGGASASVDQALRAAEATIRGRYANLGMTGSSSEAQDLAAMTLRGEAMRFQLGQQLAQTGLQLAGGADNLAASLYQAILNAETAQGTQLGNALAAFAGAVTE